MDNAFLLGADGTVIPVLHHPGKDFEFDSIVLLLSEFTDQYSKSLVEAYRATASDESKNEILKIYGNSWCKVRSWDNDKLLTFRIASTNNFDWYKTIKTFLYNHPSFKNSKITVLTDNSVGIQKVFWNEIAYEDALSDVFITVIST